MLLLEQMFCRKYFHIFVTLYAMKETHLYSDLCLKGGKFRKGEREKLLERFYTDICRVKL